MSAFSTGISALQVAQRALEVIGNNVANANTPGYHRQSVTIATRAGADSFGLLVGQGVDALNVQRVRSQVIESAITKNIHEQHGTTARLRGLRTTETFLATGESSVDVRLDTLFHDFEALSGRLTDSSLRSSVVNSASTLTREINGVANNLNKIRGDVREEINGVVEEINSRAREIAQINEQISRTEGVGVSANDLRDRRDQLINEIAERIDVEFVEQGGATSSGIVVAGGSPIVVGNKALQFQAVIDGNQEVQLRFSATGPNLTIAGGKLAGLQDLHNNHLTSYRERLDDFSRQLIQSFDPIHSTGVGVGGAFTTLQSRRAVDSVTANLDAAGLDFPPQAGTLVIGVTNTATGARTLTQLTIDPTTQSLNDIATAINGIANLTSSTHSSNGTISINAATGYTFDFTGGVTTTPPGLTGTSSPTIGGVYTGTTNDQYTFTINGTGTVGVTAGLTVTVTDSTANTVGTYNIGQGYSPNSTITVANGITVKLASGTVNNGESFASPLIAQPDSAKLLTALGLNTLFVGADAASISVSDDVLNDPKRLATSVTRAPNDSTNLTRFTNLRESPVLNGGSQTFREFFSSIVSDVGISVQEATQLEESQKLIGQRLFAEREDISGVDPNEELVQLVQFQRMFEVASKFISMVNDSYDSLLGIV